LDPFVSREALRKMFENIAKDAFGWKFYTNVGRADLNSFNNSTLYHRIKFCLHYTCQIVKAV
jgi:hypothetical protein